MANEEKFLAQEETFRTMARIVNVDDVITHPNADKLEIAIIGGWQVIIKLGEFKKNDRALYCEIDALVPTLLPEFSFLEERGENLKSIGDVTYCRIKTIKLRKEISQGLLVPIPAEYRSLSLAIGTDISKELGILKYEKVDKIENVTITGSKSWFANLARWIYGEEVSLLLPWPKFLNKSEQPRIQNMNSQYNACVANNELFEETVKLNGSSMTVYSIVQNDELKTGVCSRNLEISQEDIEFTRSQAIRRWIGGFLSSNRRAITFHPLYFPIAYTSCIKNKTLEWCKEFWTLNKDAISIHIYFPIYQRIIRADNDQFLSFALKSRLMDKLKKEHLKNGIAYTLQGELVGPGIQQNFEGLDKLEFYVYNVYFNGNIVLLPDRAREFCNEWGIKYVPVINEKVTLPHTPKDALKRADGPRALSKGGYREGIVYKSASRDFSMKCISNKFLEKEE